MAQQYADVNSLPSASYRDYILTYVDMWDHYVIYQSEQYQYIGYVWDDFGNSTLIEINRENTTGYNSRWRTSIAYDVPHEYTIVEPMYAYSTEKGQGQYFAPQNTVQAEAMSQVILTVVILMCVFLKEVIAWFAK